MNFCKLLLVIIFFSLVSLSKAAVGIVFDFDPNNDLAEIGVDNSGNSVLSAENQAIFNSAATFWTNALTGYADDVSRTLTVHASAFDEEAVMGSIRLGSAGPTQVSAFEFDSDFYVYSTAGQAEFNINADAVGADGLLDEIVIRHEIGHVLGFGLLWNTTGILAGSQNVYTDGSGQYTGANALAAYRNEFDPDAMFVPVELDGGAGTANGHWDEVGIANSLTVLSGPNMGELMEHEILTGTESGSGFLSDTTLGSFQDIGFTTRAFSATAIPEPSTLLFSFTGLFVLTFYRKRK